VKKNNTSVFPFDREIFLSNFMGMEDLADEAIASFLDCVPRYISDIQGAVQTKNAKALELAAHSLKGAVSNFYAEPSKLLAWELEQIGQSQNFQNVQVVFESLVQELTRLSDALQEARKGKAAA
jgi:HPt (histidine-containing phosphotransfer) domain-containing protein